jgi:hypothetical protein
MATGEEIATAITSDGLRRKSVMLTVFLANMVWVMDIFNTLKSTLLGAF